MLSHDNLMFDTYSSEVALKQGGTDFTDEDRLLSYLPLSHIAALNFDIIEPLHVGCCVYYARPDALQGTIV